MIIGKRKHLVKHSGFWIVTPDFHLTLNVWSENPKTYFLGEPIFIENSKKLLDQFELEFPNPKIDILDSTLLENDIDLHLKELKIEFDRLELFKITKVFIEGLTIDNDEVRIDTKTQFKGFEIWKMNGYIEIQSDFEKRLNMAGIEYEIEDDLTNGIIYLKAKKRA